MKNKINTNNTKSNQNSKNVQPKASTKQTKPQMVYEEEELGADQGAMPGGSYYQEEDSEALANLPPEHHKAPNINLSLEYAFGYRTRDTRNNLYYLDATNIAYHTGKLVILQNLKLNKQKHLNGHEDDIISFTVDKNKEYIASGETFFEGNAKPLLNVWKRNGDLFHSFKNFSDKGINCIAFSPNNTYLIAINVDDNHTIHLFEIMRKKLITSTAGGSSKILDVCFKSETEFVTVGIKHYTYWNIAEESITGEEGMFRETDNKIGLVIYHDKYFVTGSSTGEIAVWDNSTLFIYKKIHQKNVDTLHAYND